MLQDPRPSTGRREKEENETVKNSLLPSVERWHEKVALSCMHHEIGYRHLSGQDKGDRARKQPKKDQQTSDDFEHSRKAVEGKYAELIEHRKVRHVKQLGSAVLQV
jgi:hypothetical protein